MHYRTQRVSRQLDISNLEVEIFGASSGNLFFFFHCSKRHLENSMTTETPTTKSLAAVRVLSLRSVLPSYRAQGGLWEKIFGFAKTHDVVVTGATFAINYTKDDRQTDVEVEVCLPIADDAQIPEEAPFSVREVPAVDRAAVMVYTGHCEGYMSAYQTFFGRIHSKKLTPAGPSREVYVKRPTGNEEEDQDSVTEIQLPVA
ncbi:hypothetical protein F444_02955 [Phytophthora nicotianae P1976]|uniref:AraC effector-binding domain-containing protein n=1 Tax=Phytophthora nicotianae P1976 TaxID=1317066 RepID=A0A081AVP9_PHYNI|nr:hypothetical protein F444_02955 [Phytophthora nicotianae P1976]